MLSSLTEVEWQGEKDECGSQINPPSPLSPQTSDLDDFVLQASAACVGNPRFRSWPIPAIDLEVATRVAAMPDVWSYCLYIEVSLPHWCISTIYRA